MRGLIRGGLAVAALGVGLTAVSRAQQQPAPAAGRPAAPPLELRAVPASPTDPIATVNGAVITRQRLADECVARHGDEVLETLIMRSLLDQAITRQKVTVSAAEIDAEIQRHAAPYGLDKQQFLIALANERNISPRQYAEQIAFPAVALRKLSEPRVEVSGDDLNAAFEAYYGPKLHVRAIMVPNQAKAIEVWNQVRSNPGGFANLAREISIDEKSRALGGLLDQPIVRYAEPLRVSESAFEQLVDGDPRDKDPTHKPKDGDFTGPIQVSESAWVVFMREQLDPAQPVDRSNPQIIAELKARIYEAKVQAEMKVVMEDLFNAAAIDNHLTGQVKPAGAKVDEVKVDDEQVRRARMSAPDRDIPPSNADTQLRNLEGLVDSGPEMERPVGAPEAPELPDLPPVVAPKADDASEADDTSKAVEKAPE